MALSRKAKEAIKTGLAMTITYGIALNMGWDKPVWAGFAVAFVSLATVGQSFTKAALRVSGTLVATVVALAIIGLFPQERWLLMIALSAWVGLCTYMMGGAKHPYFWNVCGFVSIIVCVSGGTDSANAFGIAILRSQETGLGILVYSLVALFLWPVSSRTRFHAAVDKLASTQRRLYQAFLGQMSHRKHETDIQSLRTQLLQEQTQFDKLLESAEADTYEVWEMRQQWREFQRLSADFTATMAGWYENFSELQALDIANLLPNFQTFGAELGKRFAQIERMLAGQAPEEQPTAVDLALDEVGIKSLTHFSRAALAVTRTRLLHLETLTRCLFNTVCVLRAVDRAADGVAAAPPRRAVFVFDPDRLVSVVRVMTILWLAYLAVIFIPDIPGGFGLVSMAGPYGMMVAGNPQLPLKKVIMPIAAGVLFGAVIHIFVLPQLSSFISLGLLMFVVTFGLCYLFAAPQQILSRLFGLAMFLSVANIVNQQTYSFLGVVTTAQMFFIIFLLLAITASMPFSTRPEKVFLHMMGRFFCSAEFMVSRVAQRARHASSLAEQWKASFYRHELQTLPVKLGGWGRVIDSPPFPASTPGQVMTLVASLQALSCRIEELHGTGTIHQADRRCEAVIRDVRAWRASLEATFGDWSSSPETEPAEALQARLAAGLTGLEKRIQETLEQMDSDAINEKNAQDFYRILGGFRGVSEAAVNYACVAGTINWAQWREERF